MQWPPRLYIAIDCGGTKATAAICNQDGELVGRGRGGPANYIDIGLHLFLQSVASAVKSALYEVRMHYASLDGAVPAIQLADNDDGSPSSPMTIAHALRTVKPPLKYAQAASTTDPYASFAAPSFHSAWLGIAGVDSASDVTTLSPHLAELLLLPYPSQRLVVANDTSLLASPIANPARAHLKSGVVVIAGTGSIVMSFRRRQNGMLKVLGRVGGFGWLLGDEGSGYAVGRAAVRQVLDLADRERLYLGAAMTATDENDDTPPDSDDEQHHRALLEDGDATLTMPCTIEKQATIRRQSGGRSNTPAEYAECKMPFAMDGSMQKYSLHDRAPAQINPEQPYEYGQLLRDRILHHWRLSCTDELLRAVYFGEEMPSVKHVPTVAASSSRAQSVLADNFEKLSASHNTLRAINTDRAPHTSNSASNGNSAETSKSILSPLPPTLNATAARLRNPSPIPSLSSSPSPSPSSATYSSDVSSLQDTTSSSGGEFVKVSKPAVVIDPRVILNNKGVDQNRKHSESITSIESSFNDTDVGSTTPPPAKASSTERKHRLASLAPLVFHLAFTHNDPLSLDILRSQARLMAMQVCEIVRPGRQSRAHLVPQDSVLCLGGSLVGVQRYRELLIEQLQTFNIRFAHVEFVDDPARHGAMALANISEQVKA
jgi:N-acetylglucosamine kinase-like BadF-type ATPase